MTNTVSFGVINLDAQPKSDVPMSLPTIVHSTVVGRRTFGRMRNACSPVIKHTNTRRRSSAS